MSDVKIPYERPYADSEFYVHHIPRTMVFVVSCVATGVASLAFCSRGVSTAFLFILAFIIGRGALICFDIDTIEEGFTTSTWSTLGADELMFAILPALIFETAYAFEIQDFKKYKWQVFMLGGVAYILGLATLASMTFLQMLVAGTITSEFPIWDYLTCWRYATMMAAVDPITSTTIFHNVGVPYHAYNLMKGESIHSDGMSMFTTKLITAIEKSPDARTLLIEFGLLIVGLIISIVIGFINGRLAAFVLRSVYVDAVRENAVLAVFVYGTYAVCKMFRGSSVLGLFVFAMVMNGYRKWMNREQYEANKRMWTTMAFYSNCIVVVIVALASSVHFQWSYLIHAIVAYLLVLLSRLCVLVIFTPILRLMNGGQYPCEYTCILIWGGVRGGVSLLLAWQTYQPYQQFVEDLPQEAQVQNLILWLVGTTVAFGHLIQGGTIAWVAGKLGLAGITTSDRQHLIDFVGRMNERVKEKIAIRKTLPRYVEADWAKIEECTMLRLQGRGFAVDTTRVVDREGGEEDEDEWHVRETIQRFYDVELWKMSHFGSLSIALRHVQQAVDDATNTRSSISVDRLFQQQQPMRIWRCLSRCGGYNPPFLCVLIGQRQSSGVDAWRLLCCLLVVCQVAIIHGVTYMGARQATAVSSVGLFATGLLAVFNTYESLIRIWIRRNRMREAYCQKWNLLDWLYLISTPFFAANLILHVYIYHQCDRRSMHFRFGTGASCSNAVRTALITTSGVMWLHALFACFILVRVASFEFGRQWQQADEDTVEVLNALITISSRLIADMTTGELSSIEPLDLRKRLVAETEQVKKKAEAKIAILKRRTAGDRFLATIKTRRAAFDLVYETSQFLNAARQLGELSENEYVVAMGAIERLRMTALRWNTNSIIRTK